MLTAEFYNQLTPFYHLVYPDWEASITNQAAALDSLITEVWGGRVQTILDAACGIGTQTLGLAQLGYTMTGADLSPAAVARAKHEATTRGHQVAWCVADMRHLPIHPHQQFDLVIACDNALPHLLTDEALLTAFRAFYTCVRSRGGCLITVRDYDREERAGIQVKSYGLRIEAQTRYLVWQVWEFDGPTYDVAMYFVVDQGGPTCVTHVMRTKYYAVGTDRLMSLMSAAGFQRVQRLDDRFYQPVLIGTRE
jgi:SAM-dependent methyltransferase